MAMTTSFKQQCPSCEAMVPIRDPGLIGRKIDCPKCKYRFVVEDPGTGAEAETSAPAEKKPAPGKAGSPRRGEGKGKAEKSGGSRLLYAGVGLAVVAVAAAIVAVVIFMGDDSKSSSSKGGGGGSAAAPGTSEETPKEEKRDRGPAVVLSDITNYLPNDSQAVVSINGEKALGSSLRKAMLGTPGAFNERSFLTTMGFPIEQVSRMVIALNGTKNWVFSVMRLNRPINQKDLEARLMLVAVPPINGLPAYQVKASLDSLSNLLVKAAQPRDPLLLHIVDNQTLVFRDAHGAILEGSRQPQETKRADPCRAGRR